MIALSRITIYPIKSLDGCDLTSVSVLPTGALANDRRYALVDDQGRIVNAKRFAALQTIRTRFDLPNRQVTLSTESRPQETFLLEPDSDLAQWVGEVIGISCRLTENATHGLPDDTEAPGPTLVSTASLRAVADWFPSLDEPETRRRIRTNLEIDPSEAFWEDRLVSSAETEASPAFAIGPHQWRGVKVCQRCAVPARESFTGESVPRFQKVFADRRQESLPRWSPVGEFNHYYRLAINTVPHAIASEPLQAGMPFLFPSPL